MGIETALLVGSIISAVGAVGGAVINKEGMEASEEAAGLRQAEELKVKQALASKVTAGTTSKEANIKLQSVSAQEDEEIKNRSAKSRLRIARQGQTGGVGTGLRVG